MSARERVPTSARERVGASMAPVSDGPIDHRLEVRWDRRQAMGVARCECGWCQYVPLGVLVSSVLGDHGLHVERARRMRGAA